MKLRWFSTCDANGVKTEPTLQYWDKELEIWDDIPWVECKTWEVEEYMITEEAENQWFCL